MIVLVLLAHVLATHVLPAKKLLTREILFCVLAWVLMGLWNPSAALILAIAHALIEVARWVANAFRATADGSSGAARYGLCVFVIAEAVHGGCLYGLLSVMEGSWLFRTSSMPWWAGDGGRMGPTLTTISIGVLGYLVLIWMGSSIIRLGIAPFEQQVMANREETGRGLGLRDAGRVIGWLESSVIYVLVLSGNTAGVGFLIAAKSIFRFGELKDSQNRKEAEYFLIGTLMSFAWSLAVASVVTWAVG
ncbi:MAG: hypothetical protein CMJ31_01480 [Phycisphaerae bacterium]|nr:hypothetical protein [Phycisphaerae bacterium]